MPVVPGITQGITCNHCMSYAAVSPRGNWDGGNNRCSNEMHAQLVPIISTAFGNKIISGNIMKQHKMHIVGILSLHEPDI